MDWLEITIETTSDGIDPVCGALMNAGINGFVIEDESEFHDFLEENRKIWDYVDEELLKSKQKPTCVKVYVTKNAAGSDLMHQIQQELAALSVRDPDHQFGSLTISSDQLCEEDWEENWKQYFHPLKVGKHILIQPEWEPIQAETDRVVFTINPGMSFGTGSHDTTRLCIEAIEEFTNPGCSVLDLGCGSGILSIIALMLGARCADAVDIDPNAVNIAYENAARNGIGKEKYTVSAGNILQDQKMQEEFARKKYDLVVANIVADVIIPLTPLAQRFVEPDGVFIASGIILPRAQQVQRQIEKYFRIIEIREQNDWAAIIAKPRVE